MLAIKNANLVLENGILWDAVLLIQNGRILSFGKDVPIPATAQVLDAEGAYVGPGFVDIHVHGGDGHDMSEAPLEAVEFFLRHGTTTILPTLGYDLPFEKFLNGIRLVKQAMAAGGAGRAIAGIYMEGPYMNQEYGAGAFRNPWRHPLDPREYEALVDEAGDLAKVWAVAPEREGVMTFMEYARKVNPDVLFSLGHSEATPEQIRQLGSRYRPKLQVHCTNATGRTNDNPGVRGTGPDEYCFQDPDMYAEMICDSFGIHVNPDMQRLILHCKGLDRVILITDSATFSIPNPPRYAHVEDLNFDEIGGINGSKLTLDQACRNLMTHTNCGIAQAFLLASRNPARALGMDHEIGAIAVGKKANLVLVDDRFHIQKVLLEGQLV